MFNGINKVFIIGYLGIDPDVRYTTNGYAIASISVATSSNWKNRVTGDTLRKTEWHRVVLYNRLAEVACNYLKKGSKIYIEGSLRTVKITNKDSSFRFITEIIASNMQILEFDLKNSSGPVKLESKIDVDYDINFDREQKHLSDDPTPF